MSKSRAMRACALVAMVLGCVLSARSARAQGYAPNSCWGHCGYFAADANDLASCSCMSSCEQTGDCCDDKHLYCPMSPTAPVCPLIGVGALSSAGQVNTGLYPNVYGTDLGFTFTHAGTLNILFGDSWLTSIWGDASLACASPPTQDDMQASFASASRPSWIPVDPRASQPWSNNSCQPLLKIDLLPGFTSGFAPIGVVANSLPGWPSDYMGWLATPVGGFSDGASNHANGVFIRNEVVGCTSNAQCPSGFVCDTAEPPFAPLIPKHCVDPQIPSYGLSTVGLTDTAIYLDIGKQKPAERNNYVRGAKFLTAKFKNPALRTVTSFNPSTNTGNYAPGTGGLFMWGRPDFHASQGELPLFLLYQPLPLAWSNDTTISNWSPLYYKRAADGSPTWVSAQSDATPLIMQSASPSYGDMNLVMQSSIAFIPALKKWVMLYGGDVPDWMDLGASNDQPRTGAIHMRMADNPWGPWTAPVPVLDRYMAAPFLACDSPEPTGFDYDRSPKDGTPDSFASTGPWQYTFESLAQAQFAAQCTVGAPVRPNPNIVNDSSVTCAKAPAGKSAERSNFYGPNIITEWTATPPASVSSYARKATLYWNVSTWNPYQVLLVSTLIELPEPQLVYASHKYQLRANGTGNLVRATATNPKVDGHQPKAAEVQFTLQKVGTVSGNDVLGGALVYVSTPNGYLNRISNTSIGYSPTQVASAQWEVVATAGQQVPLSSAIALRQNVGGTPRYLAVSGSALTTVTSNTAAAKLRFTWRCEATDSCGLAQ